MTSIITSNVRRINLSNKNIKNKHWCFQISKIVSQKNYFGILIYILSWKHLFEIYFRLLRRNNKLKINNFLTNIWRNNWRFNIWRRKRTPLKPRLPILFFQVKHLPIQIAFTNALMLWTLPKWKVWSITKQWKNSWKHVCHWKYFWLKNLSARKPYRNLHP